MKNIKIYDKDNCLQTSIYVEHTLDKCVHEKEFYSSKLNYATAVNFFQIFIFCVS